MADHSMCIGTMQLTLPKLAQASVLLLLQDVVLHLAQTVALGRLTTCCHIRKFCRVLGDWDVGGRQYRTFHREAGTGCS